MKNLLKVVGFIAIIGFVMFACDVGTTPKIDPCANGHTPGTAATCETAQTCTVCSQIITASTGHNWGEWEDNVIPESCTTASKDTASCLNNNCAKIEERTGSQPALGHDLPGAFAATCIETGLTGTGHCDRCGENLTGDVIPIDSENHDFSEWTQKTAATCVAPERLIRVCSYNSAHTEEENNGEIDTTAHDWNWTLNVIAANCVSISKDTATCNNEPCTSTNERDGGDPVNPTAHDWGTGWTTLIPATCTAEEKQERTCLLNHSHYETQDIGEINPTAHDWEWTLNVIAANCVSTSKDSAICKNTPCTETNERNGNNAALGHNVINWSTYNSSNGHVSCDRAGCIGGLAAIGKRGPAGGIIFYVAASGITVQGYTGTTGSFAQYTAYYMEAAPENEAANSIWQAASGNTLIDGITTWGSKELKDAGLAASIGVGRKDTQTIVNSTAFAALTNTAAQKCVNKTLNGFKDWFLPSLGELNEMYKATSVAGVTWIPITGWFWSSSQLDNIYVWCQYLSSGVQFDNGKVNSSYVRAIRAF